MTLFNQTLAAPIWWRKTLIKLTANIKILFCHSRAIRFHSKHTWLRQSAGIDVLRPAQAISRGHRDVSEKWIALKIDLILIFRLKCILHHLPLSFALKCCTRRAIHWVWNSIRDRISQKNLWSSARLRQSSHEYAAFVLLREAFRGENHPRHHRCRWIKQTGF